MKWKCLKCGEEVSIWATVCPHCWRNPGGLMEHLVFGFFKWCFIIGIILYIPMHIFGWEPGNNNSVSQPNKQSTKAHKQQDSKKEQLSKTNTTQNQQVNTVTPKDVTSSTKIPTSTPVQKPLPKPEMDIDKAMDMFNE